MSAIELTNPGIQPASPQASQDRPQPYPPVWIGLVWTFSAAIQGDATYIPSKTGSALYLLFAFTPFFLLSGIALRRRFLHSPLPAPWSQESPRFKRLSRLELCLASLMLLLCVSSMITNYAFGVGRHDLRFTLQRDGFWSLLAWLYVLQRYISDRKLITPARPPAANWEGIQPIHSQHWGNRTLV